MGHLCYHIDCYRYLGRICSDKVAAQRTHMTHPCPKKWLAFFRAVHDSHRQAILDVIHNHREINANGIIEKVHLSQPTISHHLKILTDASIIKAKKAGKEVLYSINTSAIGDCCESFKKKFCK